MEIPLTITAKSYTRVKGFQDPYFEMTFNGFKNDETEDVLTVKPTLTTAVTQESTPGTYDIIVSGAEAQNYAIEYVNGTMTVAERKVGDVNGDTLLDEKDLKALICHIMNKTQEEIFDVKLADVNDDGKVDIVDVVMLINLLGLGK